MQGGSIPVPDGTNTSAPMPARAERGRLATAQTLDSFPSVYRAYVKTLRGKRFKPAAMRWRADALNLCRLLSERLQAEEFRFGNYVRFKVHEPKERTVLAIDFAGKVAQHTICDNALYPAVSARAVASNSAVQVGKGTHYALDLLTEQLRHYFFSRKQADLEARRAAGLPPRPMEEWDYASGWVLYCDVHKYFDSMRHDVIERQCELALAALDAPTRRHVMNLLRAVLESTDGTCGVPIGNQTSQNFGVLYLDGLDHLLCDEMGLVYGRYMDDFYVIHESKDELRRVRKVIEGHCAGLGLELNDTSQIRPLRNGVNFLGWHLYLTDTGKVVKKVKAKTIDNRRRKIRMQRKAVDAGEMTLEQVRFSYESWRGHIAWGDTYHLERKMTAYFHRFFPEIRLKGEEHGDTGEPGRGQQAQAGRVRRRCHHLDCGRP